MVDGSSQHNPNSPRSKMSTIYTAQDQNRGPSKQQLPAGHYHHAEHHNTMRNTLEY